jgi:4-diphosphocytidyl-2C-methyl-D-erythritol kinase
MHVLLVFSNFPLSTKDVFARFDELYPSGDALSEDLRESYLRRLGLNSLKPAALSLRPELNSIMGLDLGIAGGFLSGSGPTVWFVSSDEQSALAAQERANELGLQTVLTKTSNLGARLS